MRDGRKKGRTPRALLAGASLLLVTVAAGAVEPGSDLAQQILGEQRRKLERTVYEADRQIEAGEVQGRERAEAFRARGIARSRLLQHAEAAQDFTQAIELDQVNPQYYEDRAIVYLKLGEYKAASRDLDMALGLETKRSSSFREKGRLAFYQGDFALAAREFQRALETAKGEAVIYSAMWLHIAIERGALSGAAPLAPILAQIGASRWPSPILQMYTGAIQPEEAVAAATATNPHHDLLLKCEAYFYAGQEYLIRNQKDKARAAFEMALASGATEFLEYDWSAHELARLGAAR